LFKVLLNSYLSLKILLLTETIFITLWISHHISGFYSNRCSFIHPASNTTLFFRNHICGDVSSFHKRSIHFKAKQVMEVSLGVRMVHYSCIGLYLNTMCKFKVIIPPGLAGPMSVLGVGPVS